ncbi:MAG TPA: hypothetical protein VNT02_07595 [Burkholderiales bacterium]|nr:hypothetical protein [Burkholderiales bacterium]
MDNVEVSPIAGWQIGTIGKKRVVVFRPHYLDKGQQDSEHATPGRYYVMTPSQCLSLICELTAAVHDLENAPPAAPPTGLSPLSRGRGHRAKHKETTATATENT